MVYITFRNYKGGINNLIIASDSETGLTATSTKSKEAAIVRLDHKITQRRKTQNNPPDLSQRPDGQEPQ